MQPKPIDGNVCARDAGGPFLALQALPAPRISELVREELDEYLHALGDMLARRAREASSNAGNSWRP